MSGRHHKASSTARNLSAITTSGALAVVALGVTQGEAHADEDPWAPLIHCESGGNPKAQNSHSTASGLFQITDPTWASNGGRQFARRAKDATPEQQRIVAERIAAARGLQPWEASEHCWGGKTSASKIRGSKHAKPEPKHEDKPKTQPAPGDAELGGYIVRAGQSLSDIANEHHVTWQQLWDANRAAVADPNLIHAGLKLAIPGVAPADHSALPMQFPTGADTGQKLQVRMTGYSWHDNTPAGSPEISSPVVHKTAGGTGTFDDPITVAVPGHAGSGMEQPAGTKFYSPDLKRYLIVEDSGASDASDPHLDVYVDGEGLPKSASDQCMDSITGTKTVIESPGPGLPVTAGPLTGSGGCHI